MKLLHLLTFFHRSKHLTWSKHTFSFCFVSISLRFFSNHSPSDVGSALTSPIRPFGCDGLEFGGWKRSGGTAVRRIEKEIRNPNHIEGYEYLLRYILWYACLYIGSYIIKHNELSSFWPRSNYMTLCPDCFTAFESLGNGKHREASGVSRCSKAFNRKGPSSSEVCPSLTKLHIWITKLLNCLRPVSGQFLWGRINNQTATGD